MSRRRIWMITLGAALAVPFGCSLATSFDGLAASNTSDGDASTPTTGDGSSATDAGQNNSEADGGQRPMDAGGNAYAAAVLADRPIAYYHLDDPSGSKTARDSSGNGHDGTVSKGSITFGSPGAFPTSGNSAHFDGKSFIAIADSIHLDNSATDFDFTQSTPFTLEAWVQIDMQPVKDNTAFTFFSKELHNADGGYDGIDFFTQPDFKLQREEDPIDNTELDVPHGFAATATWYYLVGTYDGTQLTIYFDLVAQGVAQSGTAVPVVPVPLLLGAEDRTATEALVGSMDEVAIYRQALSPSQMAAHFHAAGR